MRSQCFYLLLRASSRIDSMRSQCFYPLLRGLITHWFNEIAMFLSPSTGSITHWFNEIAMFLSTSTGFITHWFNEIAMFLSTSTGFITHWFNEITMFLSTSTGFITHWFNEIAMFLSTSTGFITHWFNEITMFLSTSTGFNTHWFNEIAMFLSASTGFNMHWFNEIAMFLSVSTGLDHALIQWDHNVSIRFYGLQHALIQWDPKRRAGVARTQSHGRPFTSNNSAPPWIVIRDTNCPLYNEILPAVSRSSHRPPMHYLGQVTGHQCIIKACRSSIRFANYALSRLSCLPVMRSQFTLQSGSKVNLSTVHRNCSVMIVFAGAWVVHRRHTDRRYHHVSYTTSTTSQAGKYCFVEPHYYGHPWDWAEMTLIAKWPLYRD